VRWSQGLRQLRIHGVNREISYLYQLLELNKVDVNIGNNLDINQQKRSFITINCKICLILTTITSNLYKMSRYRKLILKHVNLTMKMVV